MELNSNHRYKHAQIEYL